MTAKTWSTVIGVVTAVLVLTLFFQYQEMELYGVADKIVDCIKGIF